MMVPTTIWGYIGINADQPQLHDKIEWRDYLFFHQGLAQGLCNTNVLKIYDKATVDFVEILDVLVCRL